MPPPPKPRDVRQNRIKRPELSIVGRGAVAVLVPALPTELRRPLPATVEKWEAYWHSPVAQIALESGGLDLAGLQRWIINVEEWHRAMRAFRSRRIVTGSTGQPRLNPLASYLSEREAAIRDAEQHYGMTPLARLKLGVAVGQARLTAQELNRALEDNGHRDHDDTGNEDDADLAAEFEEAH